VVTLTHGAWVGCYTGTGRSDRCQDEELYFDNREDVLRHFGWLTYFRSLPSADLRPAFAVDDLLGCACVCVNELAVCVHVPMLSVHTACSVPAPLSSQRRAVGGCGGNGRNAPACSESYSSTLTLCASGCACLYFFPRAAVCSAFVKRITPLSNTCM